MTDGVTLGHPCCAEHECKVPLSNVHHEYCKEHRSNNLICCVEGCSRKRGAGFKTCSKSEHRNQEDIRKERRRKVKRVSRPRTDEGDEEEEVPNRRKQRLLPGTFSRKWTHNEQLMVRPCGIVIGRATFYNFESMGAVKARLSLPRLVRTLTITIKEFLHSVFPLELPGIEPEFLFFDNACGLRSFIEGCQDFDLLCRMAIVVDAFHFSGHKQSHASCQENCNPKVFPVLKGRDGKWLFNSSAAEQVNAWFGKFQPKVKEMNHVRSDRAGTERLNH